MRATWRKSIGAFLTVVGWILSLGGIGIAALVTLPLFLAGGDSLYFALALLLMAALVISGPVFVNLGDQLRFPTGESTICPRCDYDLRGRPGAGCPECGWQRLPAANHSQE